MFSYPRARSLIGAGLRLKDPASIRPLSTPSPQNPLPQSGQETTPEAGPPSDLTTTRQELGEPPVKEWAERLGALGENTRLPRSVQAIYLRSLRRKAIHGLPVCDLHLRSYSVQNLEFFADFALRAAYYLNLPVSGPVPLPRIIERWTVPRSHFVHKKSQENFERITLRRLIQIKDGHLEGVQAWLAFLRKHAFYGVGMKANVWEHQSLDVGQVMDESLSEIEKSLSADLAQFGKRKGGAAGSTIFDTLGAERFTGRNSL